MQSNNNIENLFRTNLSEVKVDPSSDNWENINTQLNDKSFETLFKRKLEKNTIPPEAKTWGNISSHLSKKAFWKFNINTINIYSISAVITILTSLSFISYPLINNSSPNIQSQTVIANSSKTDLTTQNSLIEKDITSNSSSDGSNGLNKNNNSTQQYANNTNSKQIIVVKDDNTENDKKKEETKRTTQENPTKASNNTTKLIVKNELDKTFIDTLVIYDTIQYYDTLIVESNLKPKEIANKWSFTPRISIFSAIPSHTGSNSNSSKIADIYNDANSNNLSYSFGLGVSYDYKAWKISSGIDYTLIQEEFNYKTNKIETTPVTKYSLTENGYYNTIVENITYILNPQYIYNYDTISTTFTIHKVDYDNYSVVDTIWKYKIDSNIVRTSDSTEIINYDTIRMATYDTTYYNSIDTNIYTTYYQNINKYTYLDIPLTIGYGFTINKITLRPTIGAIFGIMLNAKGKGVSLIDKNKVYTLENSELPFANFQISMLIGLGIEYRIYDKLLLSFQPFYKRNLSSIYQSNTQIDKRFTGIGASFGLSFFFK